MRMDTDRGVDHWIGLSQPDGCAARPDAGARIENGD
jgi:hypothetical protein